MHGFHVVVSAPSIHRTDVINAEPTSLCDARRVLWAYAARLERMHEITQLEPEYWISDTGQLCEGITWRYNCDGVDDCRFLAYITDDVDTPVDGGGADRWIHE